MTLEINYGLITVIINKLSIHVQNHSSSGKIKTIIIKFKTKTNYE